MKDKPKKIGFCKYCDNPVYDWSDEPKDKQDYHEGCKYKDETGSYDEYE